MSEPVSSKKVLHIITGLTTGGAEMMLLKLVRQNKDFRHVIVVLNGCGDTMLAKLMAKEGYKIYYLGMKESRFKLPALWRLLSILKKERPALIQTWMYHANVIGLLSKLLFVSAPIIWNVRHSLHDIKHESRMMKLVLRISRLFSQIPERIIYNSQTSRIQHERFGFSDQQGIVLANGFDLNLFNAEHTVKAQLRSELMISSQDFVFIVVGRFHPMKGHLLFLDAFAQARDIIATNLNRNVHVVMIGPQLDSNNHTLVTKLDQHGLIPNIHLLGEQKDVAKWMNIADALILPSLWGEGFSNVVGEAMAMALPTIVSDVGDSAWLVDQSGFVINAGDQEQLSASIVHILKLASEELAMKGKLARKRMEDNFSIEAISNQYSALYRSCV